MPQLNPASYASQLFWLAITFVTLYLLMAKLALPRIRALIEERQRRIDEALDAVARMTAEAQAALADYEAALADARTHARRVVKEAADRVSRQTEDRHREIHSRVSEQIHAGEARIAAAKATALADVDMVARDLAGTMVARLTGASPDPAGLDAAIDGASRRMRLPK